MKLATFENAGRQSFGAVAGDRVHDLGAHFAGDCPDLETCIRDDRFADARAALAAGGLESHALADLTLLPPVTRPGRIICVGLNYATHRDEGGHPQSEYPIIFARFPGSQIGHETPMWVPKVSTCLDYEGELAVIIARDARYVSEDDALSLIAGYACYNDGSVRDFQQHTRQIVPGKNFPHSGAFGPWMVTGDEISDPANLTLTTRLNGEVMQQANTSQLIFTIPYLIAYCSTFAGLSAGDVIVTGTPGGVGFRRDPQVWMKPGDRVEVEITDVGTLSNSIIEEPA